MANKLEKPRGAAEADASTEKDNPLSGKLPTKAAVGKLANTVQTIDGKLAKLRGEKGSAIKVASDDDNVHKGAFREAMKQLAMDPEERANYQRHLAKYQRDLDIQLQGDLLKDAPAR